MARKKGLHRHREEIVERLRAGESYGAIARHFGCHRWAIQNQARKAGVTSRHKSGHEPHMVEIRGERMRLSEASRRYGISRRTLWHRIQAGDTGERLIRPVRPISRPESYPLGVKVADWKVYAELAREIGVRRAAAKLGVPYGAITAAMRGEEERLA